MEILVTAPDKKELMEVLAAEGILYNVATSHSVREMGTGSYGVERISANVPEVDVPPTYRDSSGETRAYRLPSGRLILTDLEGNLEQITTPPPGK